MKIECLNTNLREALSKTERAVGKNLSLPVLGYVLLEAVNKKIILKATNLDLGVEVEVPGNVSSHGVVAIPNTTLASILSGESEKVTLESYEENLLVKTKNSSSVIKTVPHDEFPNIPRITSATRILIPVSDFINGIRSVWYSASISTIKPELASVFVYYHDKHIVFVSTDTFRLAEKKIPIEKNSDFDPFLIPVKNIPEIIRAFDGFDGVMDIQITKNQASFTIPGIHISSRIVEGTFPDYQQVIPKDFTTHVVLLKYDFINALKKATSFSGKFYQIYFSVDTDKKRFEITSKNNDIGEHSDVFDAAIEGDDLMISFNYRYIIDCFQSISSDSISLNLVGPSKPMVIRGIGDGTFCYLVMPMNK